MGELLAVLLGWPTAPLTVLMGLAVLYWIFVILGALHIDLIPFDGHGDAGHDVGHDGHDLGHGNPNVVLEFLRVGQVPLTIIISIFVAVAFCVCMMATFYLHRWLPGGLWWLIDLATLAGSLVLAFFTTGLAMRPLGKALSVDGAMASTSLVGRMVTITSSTVDAKFGTALYDMPGTGQDIILNCVCTDGTLAKGEQAVVMDYDRATGVYVIAPLPHTRPGFLPEPAAPAPTATSTTTAPPAEAPARTGPST